MELLIAIAGAFLIGVAFSSDFVRVVQKVLSDEEYSTDNQTDNSKAG